MRIDATFAAGVPPEDAVMVKTFWVTQCPSYEPAVKCILESRLT